MPITAFHPRDVINKCMRFKDEPWANFYRVVREAFAALIHKATRSYINERGGVRLWIHIYHTFDDEGNQLPFRRIDYVNALHKWIMHLTQTEITEANEWYYVMRLALMQVEPRYDPTRDWQPVDCMILDGEVYMNGHM